MAPEASRANGCSPRALHTSEVSGSIGTLSSSTASPKPDAPATSCSAANSPPSVMSCNECTCICEQIRASCSTLIPGVSSIVALFAITFSLTPDCRNSPAQSLASRAVPSMASPLVTMMLSPSWAPPVVMRRSRSTSPSIVPITMGRWMPWVTSLWPPIRVTPKSRQLCIRSSKRSLASSCVNDCGTRSVARNQRGVAPVQATSLAQTWTAYHPARSVAKVTGSLFATSSRSPKSSAAASSPTRGPSTTRGSSVAADSSNRSSSSGGNFPISMSHPPSADGKIVPLLC